jgi:tRNA(adenine34) deaminase
MKETIDIHTKYMQEALKEARKALKFGDVPIGAVIVSDNKIIGRGYNQVEKKNDSTAHAEIIAIKSAIKKYGYKHLLNCTIYVTLEPCTMCSGAIVLARIPYLVYGAEDPKAGASGSLYAITDDKRLNHRCQITNGILADECSIIIKDFFHKLRKNDKL